MSRSAGPAGRGGSGSFIVVPPNERRYTDPEVIQRLEAFVRKRLPMYDIEIAWVVQPRIETFTVVERQHRDDVAHAKEMILGELEAFDPEAPEPKAN